ncbi:MAG: hypothetical protein ACRDQZ_25155 [Mycobacteriales bacterium]
MKVKGDYAGIPGWWIDDDESPSKDGKRFVTTKAGWKLMRRRVYEIDGGACQGGRCSRRGRLALSEGHVHHLNMRGRGLGSSVREDRPWITLKDGKRERNLCFVCPSCHDRVERPQKVVPVKELATDVCFCGVFRVEHPTNFCQNFRLKRRATRIDVELRQEGRCLTN